MCCKLAYLRTMAALSSQMVFNYFILLSGQNFIWL